MARIVITGAAGLVGQNLIADLLDGARAQGEANSEIVAPEMVAPEIVAIDKHKANTAILAGLHPGITVIEADLAEPGEWEQAFAGCDALVQLHAQIGGLDGGEFERNNVIATRRVMDAAKAASVPYLVHVSSSVVNSMATDFYTESKKEQEAIVEEYDIPHATLRPTLMFGLFDRKHLGWLARFMMRVPVFPIPGSGRYLRQPLYAGDFSAIVRSCLDGRRQGAWNISGRERIDYIDLMRAVREATGARTPIMRIPYSLFWFLLTLYAVFSRNPPFTTKQLEALVTPDVFELIDWPEIFGVEATPLDQALRRSYRESRYSDVVLEF